MLYKYSVTSLGVDWQAQFFASDMQLLRVEVSSLRADPNETTEIAEIGRHQILSHPVLDAGATEVEMSAASRP